MIHAYTVRRRFERFNRAYFDNKLPIPQIVVLCAGQAGQIINACSDWGGVGEVDGKLVLEVRSLSSEVDSTFLNAIILHEQVHIQVGLQHDHKSRKYRLAVRRLSLKGALKEVL